MTRGLMTMMASRYERRAVERQRARWHDPVLRRWLGLTSKRPALCLREKGQRARRSRAATKQGSEKTPPVYTYTAE